MAEAVWLWQLLFFLAAAVVAVTFVSLDVAAVAD